MEQPDEPVFTGWSNNFKPVKLRQMSGGSAGQSLLDKDNATISKTDSSSSAHIRDFTLTQSRTTSPSSCQETEAVRPLVVN
jgi:hypothetical protein